MFSLSPPCPPDVAEDEKILSLLAKKGVMAPSKIVSETRLTPSVTLENLEKLTNQGLLSKFPDDESLDGYLVAITVKGLDKMKAW